MKRSAMFVLAGIFVSVAPSQAQQGRGAAAQDDEGRPPVYNYGWKSQEYLVLGDATRGAGEPQIAVDPTNPKNIVVVAMANLQQLPPGATSFGSMGRSTITSLAVSHDGGITWKIGELPLMYSATQRCPDPFVEVTKDGTFIGGCEARQTTPGGSEGSAIMLSLDKGETWGPRADMIGWNKDRFAPGLTPRIAGASPYDRPFTVTDDSTGVIYGVAQGGLAEDGPGKTRQQAYITASSNGGKSFGTIYAWDSPQYPQLSKGLSHTAAFGEVAIIYAAASVPAAENAKCPCPIMGVSRDLGKTFTYRIVKGVPADFQNDQSQSFNPPSNMAKLSADPTKAGHYALVSYIAGKIPHYEIVTSEDHGQTWSPPVNAGSSPDAFYLVKPQMRFARNGVLALIWRAVYKDGTYDLWSAISKDGGRTVSKSLRVSHARSPSKDNIKVGANDDYQDLATDDVNLHMVWGDSRAGFQGVFYGRVPFSAYEFGK